MSRNREYQRLLNDKRWKELRTRYLQLHPLCERCQREGIAAGVPGGYIRSAVDLHHKIPVMSFRTLAEMERACYDWNNLEALCVPCHIKTHQEMGKNTKENEKQRAATRLEQWKERLTNRFTTKEEDDDNRV